MVASYAGNLSPGRKSGAQVDLHALAKHRAIYGLCSNPGSDFECGLRKTVDYAQSVV